MNANSFHIRVYISAFVSACYKIPLLLACLHVWWKIMSLASSLVFVWKGRNHEVIMECLFVVWRKVSRNILQILYGPNLNFSAPSSSFSMKRLNEVFHKISNCNLHLNSDSLFSKEGMYACGGMNRETIRLLLKCGKEGECLNFKRASNSRLFTWILPWRGQSRISNYLYNTRGAHKWYLLQSAKNDCH